MHDDTLSVWNLLTPVELAMMLRSGMRACELPAGVEHRRRKLADARWLEAHGMELDYAMSNEKRRESNAA